ncbi:MAG: MBL fold metallo-hydrolase [Porticoccus sp.]|nr:MBL fold metallo-hydrolase [Porticoccus sp.]
MRFTSLGSGSKGNATVVHCGDTRVLIDCGFSAKEAEKRLLRVGLEGRDLAAIVVTHEHADHIRGVLPLAKKHNLPVMMTVGTSKVLNDHSQVDLTLVDSDSVFAIGELELKAVAVAHDAREPVQYVVRGEGLTLGVLTDLGSITPHVLENYRQCDGLLVESNHDVDMLADGSYPPSLKHRVGGAWGHLNNQQTLHLLQNIDLEQLQHLVIGHISQQNNSLDLVKDVISAIEGQLPVIHYACQEEGFSWIELLHDEIR